MKLFGFEIKKSGQEERKEIIVKQGTYKISGELPKNLYDLFIEELSNLKPDNMKIYLEAARKDLNFFKALLFEEIRRRDLRIGGICQTRKLAVMGKKWSIQCNNDEIFDFATRQLKRVREKPIRGQKPIRKNFFTDITEASIQGISPFEINYGLYNQKVYVDTIKRIQNHILVYDSSNNAHKFLDMRELDVNAIRDIQSSVIMDKLDLNRLSYIDIDPDKVLIARSLDGDSPNGFLNGCIDSLIWGYFFKNWTIEDWAMFMERFAKPVIKGSYDSLMGDKEKDALFKFVKGIRENKSGIHPNDAEVGYMSDSTRGISSDMYAKKTDYWNKEMTIRVLGQELTTDIGDIGSKAASDVADRVRDDIMIADLELITDTVNELLDRLIWINWASPSELPGIEFEDLKRLKVQKALSDIYLNIKTMGYRVTKEIVEEKFGIKVDQIEDAAGQGHATKTDPTKAEGNEAGLRNQYGLSDTDLNKIGELVEKKFAAVKGLTDQEIEEYVKEIWKSIKN